MNTLRVFLSHSHEDNDFGLRFVHDLRRALGGDDDTVWYDQAGGLHGGDNWWRTILKEIPARPVFIVILSPSAMTSPWVNDEIDIAWRLTNSPAGKLILPVLYHECDMRLDLQGVHYVSFVAPRAYDDAFQEVLSALSTVQRNVAGTAAMGSQTDSTQLVTIQRPTPKSASRGAGPLNLPVPLRVAFTYDLTALDRYWGEVFYGPDSSSEGFERYHRLALNPLPAWQHSWYEAQVKANITHLDPGTFGRIHALLERFSLVDLYRGKMRTQFETNAIQQLWDEYIDWKQAYTSGSTEERTAAQARYRPLSKRLNDFCLANVELWNAFAALMNLIREAGNPIAPLSEYEDFPVSVDREQPSRHPTQGLGPEAPDSHLRPAVVPMTEPPLRQNESGVEYFDPDFSQHQQALLNAGKEPAFNIWGVLFGPKQPESAHVLDRRRTLSYGGPLMPEQTREVSASPGRTLVTGDISIDGDPAYCLLAPPEPSLGAMLYHDAPRILARCTITYRNMHGRVYATVSDFTANHEWRHTFLADIPRGIDELDDEVRRRLFPNSGT